MPWNSSGVFLVAAASVLNDLRSRLMSILSVREARPENALTTSYGEEVRLLGIVDPSASWPEPFGLE